MAKKQVVVQLEWHGENLLQRIRRNQESALLEAAEMLRDAAVAKAPQRSGKLRDSAYVARPGMSTYRKSKLHRKEAPVGKGQALVGFAAFYALMVEKGTRYAAARPYLRPAYDELREQLGKKVSTELGKAVNK